MKVFDPQDYALGILKEQTKRDKQVKIGASNASNPCTRCLADDLLGNARPPSRYWLGAKIGTAIHEYLEHNAPDGVMAEVRVTLGEVEGYGVVKSTSDLFVPWAKHVVDWKTTTRSKLKTIKGVLDYGWEDPEVRCKLQGYTNQIMLYASAVPGEVEKASIVFICRDGTGDNDIWTWTQDYDAERAALVWDRVNRLWAWLREGNDPDMLVPHPGCWYCNNVRGD